MTLVTPKKVILMSALLTVLLLCVVLLAETLGSVRVPFRLSIQILIQSIVGGKVSGTETEQAIILSLRFPRAILAGLVGAGLSVSGAVFQALLRNPLADPYILGVSSGAAVGAIVAHRHSGVWAIPSGYMGGRAEVQVLIISMSGSHDFLIERGIIPTWHMECDPRIHKAEFLKNPHPGVEYLISSNCHPKLFDQLEGYNLKVWHLFGNES